MNERHAHDSDSDSDEWTGGRRQAAGGTRHAIEDR